MSRKPEAIVDLYCCECGGWHTWRIVHRPGTRKPYRAQLRNGRQLIEQHKAASFEEAAVYIACALAEDGAVPLEADGPLSLH